MSFHFAIIFVPEKEIYADSVSREMYYYFLNPHTCLPRSTSGTTTFFSHRFEERNIFPRSGIRFRNLFARCVLFLQRPVASDIKREGGKYSFQSYIFRMGFRSVIPITKNVVLETHGMHEPVKIVVLCCLLHKTGNTYYEVCFLLLFFIKRHLRFQVVFKSRSDGRDRKKSFRPMR